MTEAHDQRTTIHVLCHVPEHEPREDDPHYHLFDAAKRRMKKLGLLKCSIPNCTFPGPIELHHTQIEFSLIPGVDLELASKAYGHHFENDEDFAEWCESPGNLEPLCPMHHRSHLGIHSLPGPLWEPLRVWKAGMAPPAEVETQSD